MSSRLAYPYPQWVYEARYSDGYNILAFNAYNAKGRPRRHLMRFLAQCGNAVFLQALLLKLFPLFIRAMTESWFFTLP